MLEKIISLTLKQKGMIIFLSLADSCIRIVFIFDIAD